MFWFIIFGVLFLAGIICLIIYACQDYYDKSDALIIIGAGLAFMGFALGMCCFGVRADYNKFERSFEIQKEVIEEVVAANPEIDMNLIYVADMVEANKELADYKAAREIYGFFSLVPERVFEIEPIGAS